MHYLLIIVPLFSVLALNLPFRKEAADRLALWWGMLLCAAEVGLALCSSSFAPPAWSDSLAAFIGPVSPAEAPLSRVMFLAIGIAACAALMTARYMIGAGDRLFLFSCLVLLAVAGMNGVVLASDLFTLYVFLELTAVASFILIAFDRGQDGYEGAFKYFILSVPASGMLLTGIGIFALTGEGLSFDQIGNTLAVNSESALVWSAAALLCAGFFIKGGLVPFHGWLPDAYSSAPAGASVLLAGIVTKTAGIYSLTRLVLSVFKVPDLLMGGASLSAALLTFGTVSLLAGALLALAQSDFKRMLAYCSISQVGYIVLGLGAGNLLGMAGALFHIFNHSLFKSLLFINAAAVEKESGLRDINEMKGLGGRMPISAATSVVAMLSAAGIPPLSGFWSKLMIIVALWQAGFEWVAAVALLGSLITLAYFLFLQRRVFFCETLAKFSGVKEAGWWALVPALFLAAVTVGLGLAFPWLIDSFLVPVPGFL